MKLFDIDFTKLVRVILDFVFWILENEGIKVDVEENA